MELEKELKNCSLEIEYLQNQLSLRSIEASCMGQNVHSLELKLSGVEMLHEKLRLLTEELVLSDDKCLQLTLQIKSKDKDLKNYAMQIGELETFISANALEFQCEIESLKLDMIALEERCFQAESLNHQLALDKSRMHELSKEYELQLHDAHATNSFLEMENNELKEKLQSSERKFTGLHRKVEEHLSNWFNGACCTSPSLLGEPHKKLSSWLKEKHSSLDGICTCEVVLCPLVSKLSLLTVWDEIVMDQIQKMANEMHESELLVEKLKIKEELREERFKAKEEAEDLTQAMAELRYEITGMLEDECKRRASIEQISLRRIQDLEEQVRNEQRKHLSALNLLHEFQKISETQCCGAQLSERNE